MNGANMEWSNLEIEWGGGVKEGRGLTQVCRGC